VGRDAGFDHFSITLAPGALSESTPHEAGVIEHVVVISGELEMNIDGSGRRFLPIRASVSPAINRTPTATAATGRCIFTP
jgi:glyoxylate utilization-related uncharacterized protein